MICPLTYGQTRQFINQAEELLKKRDSVYAIEVRSPEPIEYDFISDGMDDLELVFLGVLKKHARTRPDELQSSYTLQTLATLATEAWKGSQYSDAKKWRKLDKYFRRASQKSTTGFNLTKQISFRIPLADNEGKRFYYDRKGPSGGMNLYTGRKPKKRLDADDEDYEEPIPLNYNTEEVLVEKFLKELRRKSIMADLKRGGFAYAGVSVEIDERTVFRNRMPTARVVVIMGARRLRQVKVRYEPKKGN